MNLVDTAEHDQGDISGSLAVLSFVFEWLNVSLFRYLFYRVFRIELLLQSNLVILTVSNQQSFNLQRIG